MIENREPLLVLCDREEEYAHLMTEFMEGHRDLPWQIHTYTDAGDVLKEEKGDGICVLVAAENSYEEGLSALRPLRTVILNETGLMRWPEFINIDKYQQAQNVLQCILEVYMEVADIRLPQMQRNNRTCFVGMYSPVRRCMQTTFALTMGQMLAERHRTLYLNFEHYVGISELAAGMEARDLADLLYFLTTDREKFRLRIQTVVRHRGSLDYVPPMKSGQNLLSISSKEWIQLLQRIEELGEYDYVIMDLSESMQGLFDLLRLCRRVFTVTMQDRISLGKLQEYEAVLSMYKYDDVLEKTRKCSFPKVLKLPDELEQYTRGEFAGYVRRLIKELEEGG